MGQIDDKMKVRLTLERFFDNYLSKRDLTGALDCVSENISSVCSGRDEIAFGKNEFKRLLEKEFKAIQHAIDYQLEYVKEYTVKPGFYQAFAHLVTKVNLNDDVTGAYHLRLTANFHEEDGKVLIDMLHVSESSRHQADGEFYPFRYLSEGLRNLSHQTQQDLFDIVAQMVPGGVVGGYNEDGFPFYTANRRFLDMVECNDVADFIKHYDGKIINSIHQDDREYVITSVVGQLELGDQYEVEYRMLKKNGDYLYVHDIGRKTVSKDGRVAIISVIVDISTRVRQTRGILRELYQDYLTGILNRKGAKKEMQSRMKEADECLFMLVDLDNFKQVNDLYGHEQGDIVLQWFAKKLKRAFYKDVTFRLGGDEFGIYITDKERISSASQKAFQLISDYRNMIERKYPKSNSSLSIGGILKKEPYQIQDLYRLVDEILYEIKRSTKGQLIIKQID